MSRTFLSYIVGWEERKDGKNEILKERKKERNIERKKEREKE